MPSALQKKRDALAAVREEGVEVLGTEMGRSSHMRIRCRYNGEEFFKMVGLCEQGGDNLWVKKFKADLRGCKRAIDTNDSVLRAKYLSRHKA